MDEILIEGRVYVSSKQAAKITGYAKDYVGQLCREGRVEARLVGRNWYVLEDSIREHRFGKGSEAGEAAAESVSAPASSVVDRSSTWQKPQYEAEVPAFVPELAPKPEVSVSSSPAILDMQSAWKEWFEEKKPAQGALPDGSADFKDEYLPAIVPEEPVSVPEAQEEEEPVFISRAAPEPVYEPEEPEEESEVELHRSYASRSTGERMPASSPSVVDLTQRSQKRGTVRAERAASSGVMRAVLIVIAIASALVAVVGTGNADRLLAGTSYDFGVQKSIINYLGGTSIYESSL